MSIIFNIIKGTNEIEGDFYFELFDSKVGVHLYNNASVEYAERCIETLNALDEAVLRSLFESCIRYCNDFLHMTSREVRVFNKPSDILMSIEPNSLIIDQLGNVDEPIIHLELECDWDIEHGIEVIIRKGRVLFVGGFKARDPLSEFSPDDPYNYAPQ